MIIGIDASKAAGTEHTGIGNTIYPLLLELQNHKIKDDIILYTNEKLDNQLLKNKSFKEKIIPFPKFWNKFRLPLAILKDRPDKFLELTSSIPPLAPKNTAVLIHDLAFKYFPKAYSSYELFLQESAIKIAIAQAKRIIFTSQANKDDFLKFYKFPEERIDIIPLSYDTNTFKKNERNSNPLQIKEKYFLSVGRLEKRKNTAALVQAFCLFKKTDKNNIKLVLVGKPGFGYEEIIQAINAAGEFKKDIIVPGFVKHNDLAHLYNGAVAFIYPSLYEGYGFPVLEAMACETPVVTSDVATIREVSNDAVLYVNPSDIKDITNGLIRISEDKKLREKLVEKGKENIKRFSWSKSARLYLNLIDKL